MAKKFNALNSSTGNPNPNPGGGNGIVFPTLETPGKVKDTSSPRLEAYLEANLDKFLGMLTLYPPD